MQLFANNANEKIKHLPWKTHRTACLSMQKKELRNQLDGLELLPYVFPSRIMKQLIKKPYLHLFGACSKIPH